jgi:hypothetical protein
MKIAGAEVVFIFLALIRTLASYFSDRRELLEILRRAVDTMFGGAAADAGKPTWCEKKPFNPVRHLGPPTARMSSAR